MADYVYGVVQSSAVAPAGPGIADAPLRLIPGDGAAALVSDLGGEEVRLGREEILAHARVLASALEHGTVLPMRFGMVMDGDEDVRRRLLDEHADDLRAELERLQNKVEVNIRATYDEERLMREVVHENEQIARLRARIRDLPEDATYYDRIELGELVAKAVERKQQEDAHDIVAALSLIALDVEIAAPAHTRVAMSGAFLVERERLEEFDEVLDALARAQAGRLRFKYTGPLPPHSFVELDRGA